MKEPKKPKTAPVVAKAAGIAFGAIVLAFAATLAVLALRRRGSSKTSQAYYAGMKNAPPATAAWSSAGSYFEWSSTVSENAGHPPIRIFTIALGDPSKPAILLVHGYPTSSWDYEALAGELSKDHRVYALDTPGYGFSDKPKTGYKYSLFEDARLVDWYVRDVAQLHDFTLVTHDKGDSVGLALLQIYQGYGAERPYTITHHVITNGNAWLPLARLSWLQKALLSPLTGPFLSRVLTPDFLAKGLSNSVYNPPLDSAETAALASIFAYQDGTRIEHEIIGYLNERKTHEAEWLEALAHSDIPTTLVWGEKDPIAPPAVADYVWAHALAGRAAPASYWRVSKASHYIQHDQPLVLAAFIRRASGSDAQSLVRIPGAILIAMTGG
jgi:pimeloyl-ACP methyl ester carboxylesterase